MLAFNPGIRTSSPATTMAASVQKFCAFQTVGSGQSVVRGCGRAFTADGYIPASQFKWSILAALRALGTVQAPVVEFEPWIKMLGIGPHAHIVEGVQQHVARIGDILANVPP